MRTLWTIYILHLCCAFLVIVCSTDLGYLDAEYELINNMLEIYLATSIDCFDSWLTIVLKIYCEWYYQCKMLIYKCWVEINKVSKVNVVNMHYASEQIQPIKDGQICHTLCFLTLLKICSLIYLHGNLHALALLLFFKK